mgnify:CR=1 FL=1
MQLYYWPSLPGRGEYVRWVLEDLGLAYDDVARREGPGAVMAMLKASDGPPVLAPPILVDGERRLFQTPNICVYLARTYGDLAEEHLPEVLQQQLVVLDLVTETHDTHHPTTTTLSYEEQREAALVRAVPFRELRLPKFLGFAERVLASHGGDWVVGDRCTPADLAWAHTVRGLRHAFPRAMARVEAGTPTLSALVDRVVERPRLAAYLASERAIDFNAHGIFRRYPELDDPT